MNTATQEQMPINKMRLGIDWVDKKKYIYLSVLLIPIVPWVAYAAIRWTDYSWLWWIGPIFVFGVIAVLDIFFGKDPENPPEELVADLEGIKYYRWVSYLYVPFQYLTWIFATWVVATHDMSVWDYLGWSLSIGFVSGIAIMAAHELGHKTTRPLDQWLAKFAQAQIGYGHFVIEHNRGHHVRVATPEDPASSRYNESFYAFLPRTIWYGLLSGIELEKKRLAAQGYGFFSIHNQLIHSWLITVVMYVGLTVVFGWGVLPFLLVQGLYGVSVFEVVNYLEHYGLKRRKLDNGRYERCLPIHSWNSNARMTNIMLLHLQRHSDHHSYPTRAYQALRHYDDAPQLLTGYAGMIVLAYIPPLWFRVMNPRVKAFYKGDLSLANHGPEKYQKFKDGIDATHDEFFESMKQQVLGDERLPNK